MQLRYGTNPEQRATCSLDEPDSPFRLVNGQPSLINVLDAANAWQLVRDAGMALGAPAATSFKHVSPAGAAVAGPVDEVMCETWGIDDDLSPVAAAYVRARDADPKSSFSDIVAVSERVDRSLAEVLRTMIVDGVVAPGFEPDALTILRAKKGGSFLLIEADPIAVPPAVERRTVFGVRIEETTDRTPISRDAVALASEAPLADEDLDDLALAMVTARHTQSNSVAYAAGGMVVGIGAGQQSRIDCTRLAGNKADVWWLRRHPRIRGLRFRSETKRQDRINWRVRCIEGNLAAHEVDRLSDAVDGPAPEPLTSDERRRWLDTRPRLLLASDGLIPFRDNIDEASRHRVRAIADPGGSSRTAEVDAAAAEHGITLVRTGIRLFHH
jgi:phosphoribosylaminoimidazolecarboxamide formyltransferase/IMP cyclohydrolase